MEWKTRRVRSPGAVNVRRKDSTGSTVKQCHQMLHGLVTPDAMTTSVNCCTVVADPSARRSCSVNKVVVTSGEDPGKSCRDEPRAPRERTESE